MINWRNKIIHFLYKNLLKPVLFIFDPEFIHDLFTTTGKILGRFSLTRSLTKIFFDFKDDKLSQNVLGIDFINPIGLATGFDKDALLLNILPSVGFGFAEVGSVTGFPCVGNKKPRLWRLKKSEGLVVYYGLKNRGCDEVSGRLKNKNFKIPFGVSVAMTNCVENLDTSIAVKDYIKAFQSFVNIGDYITINISCPNAQGGQPFLVPDKLDLLFSEIDKIEIKKPIFVKLSPDMTLDDIDIILDILKKHRVQGLICSNLTKPRNNPFIKDINFSEKGGISGKPLQKLSDDLLSYIYRKEGKRFILVGCGGVFNAEDAYRKIRSGATLVQLITGMIFEGPQLISEINQGLMVFLKRDGFSNISEAIGVDNNI